MVGLDTREHRKVIGKSTSGLTLVAKYNNWATARWNLSFSLDGSASSSSSASNKLSFAGVGAAQAARQKGLEAAEVSQGIVDAVQKMGGSASTASKVVSSLISTQYSVENCNVKVQYSRVCYYYFLLKSER